MIISTRSTSTQRTNYPGTKLVAVVFKIKKRIKNTPSCGHVLHKTLNLVISRCCFANDDREMYQNLKRTYRGIVFFLINPFVLWRCSCRRRGVFVRPLLATFRSENECEIEKKNVFQISNQPRPQNCRSFPLLTS